MNIKNINSLFTNIHNLHKYFILHTMDTLCKYNMYNPNIPIKPYLDIS